MDRIIYTSPFIPAEWIKAHGLQPSRILPNGLGEKSITGTAGMCHFMEGFTQYFNSAEGVVAAIFTTECDQMRRAPECLTNGEIQRFLFNLPATWQSPESHKLFISELRRLGTFLCEMGGIAPEQNTLLEVMDRYDSLRTQMRDLRGTTSTQQFIRMLHHFNANGEILQSHSMDSLPKGIPIALVGGPLTADGLTLYDILEKAGGAVVLDGTETGERTMPRPFHRQRMLENPLAELVDSYFGHIPEVWQRPNNRLFQWMKESITKRDVRGVILVRNIWCDLWHAELHRLRDWLEIPLLDLDLNGYDPVTRSNMRIQAFMEALS